MKRIITILMTLAIWGSPLYASISRQQPDNKTIELSTTETGDTGNRERSLFIVIATYSSVSSTVEVSTFGCGSSTAYMYDSIGTLVSTTTISADDGIGTLSVPEASGLYYIIINSERCYSQGSFVKE